jgi:hypothetical protein
MPINPTLVRKFRPDLVDFETGAPLEPRSDSPKQSSVIADIRSRGWTGLGRPWCFGLTVEPGGLIAAPMINAATTFIARRRRTIAVWADVSI